MEENKNILQSETPAADNAKNGKKKKIIIIVSAVLVLVIACAALLLGFSGAFGCDGFGNAPIATGDEVPTLNIDEEKFTFAEGIYIGEAAIGGHTYKEARQIAQTACESMIHDFELTVKARDKEFSYTKANFTWDTNVEQLLVEAATYSDSISDTSKPSGTTSNKDKVFELSFQVNTATVEAAVQSIAGEVDVEPKNASIGEPTDDDITVIREVAGYKLDQASLLKEMMWEIERLSTGTKNSASIKAKINEVQPSLKYNDLDGKIQLLASYSSYSSNTEAGCQNMAIALSKCNGSVIEPGETWSFSAHAGNTNSTAAGYLSATVITNGKYTQGIGGGVCQASTTIYNAAIRTNMVIAERHNHYYKSSYADAGLDATIAYPALDMKLKNPTEYPMYLQCYMSGRTLYCNIYGWQDPSFDEVKVYASTYDANPSENYYRARAYRVFLKDGKEVSREDLPSSLYHYTSGESTTTKPAQNTKPTKPQTTKPAKPTKPPVTQAPTVPVVTTLPPATQAPVTPEPTNPAVTPDPTEAVTP